MPREKKGFCSQLPPVNARGWTPDVSSLGAQQPDSAVMTAGGGRGRGSPLQMRWTERAHALHEGGLDRVLR